MKIRAWGVIPILILICQISCRPEKKLKSQNYYKEFEGKITYHEIIKDITGAMDIDDTVQLFYFNGNFVGIHSSRTPRLHVVKDYYLADKPLRLVLFNTSDTLFQLGLNPSNQQLDSFSVKKISEKLVSRNCEIVELNVSFPEKASTTYTNITYTFSRGFLKMDKKHFREWNLGFFNKFINESGAYFLKYKIVHFDSSHKKILSTKTYDVLSVKEEEIDHAIFAIDTAMIKSSPN